MKPGATMKAADYRRRLNLPPAGSDRKASRPKMTEVELQILVSDWLRHLTWEPPAPVWTHPANERASKAEAVRCWRMGQRSGIPDFVFWMRNQQTLAIELKTADGKQSKAQKEVEAELKALAHPYVVCRSLEDVYLALRLHGGARWFTETPLARALRASS